MENVYLLDCSPATSEPVHSHFPQLLAGQAFAGKYVCKLIKRVEFEFDFSNWLMFFLKNDLHRAMQKSQSALSQQLTILSATLLCLVFTRYFHSTIYNP